MEAESQKRAPQKNEKQRACPIERRAVDMVSRRPECPEELVTDNMSVMIEIVAADHELADQLV